MSSNVPGVLRGAWHTLVQDAAPVDLAARLTLLTVLLSPIGDWFVHPAIVMLAGFGLVAPGAHRSPWLWLAMTLLSAWRVVGDWPLADNHAYLLVYWCLALAIALATDTYQALARTARILIGLVFTLAVVQKATTPDFVDDTFFTVLYLLDQRFQDMTVLLTGLSLDDISRIREALIIDTQGKPALGPLPLYIPDALRNLARFSTWWSLFEQAAVAITFLAPASTWLYRRRDIWLLLFCLTAYLVAPVPSFGWLLIAMAMAQCGRGAVRAWYLVTFALLALYFHVPWAKLLADVFG